MAQVSDGVEQSDPGHHWRAGVGRTIGLNIPRQIASPQSPTPFLQAPIVSRRGDVFTKSLALGED